MWVYLETWLVGDGQLPEITVNSRLDGVALRMMGSGSAFTAATEALAQITALPGIAELRYRHRFVGVPTAAIDVWMGGLSQPERRHHVGAEFMMTCGELTFIALAENLVQADVVENEPLAISGSFWIMHDMERDEAAEEHPEVIRSWTVRAIQIEQYVVHWRTDHPGPTRGLAGRPGRVRQRVDIGDVDAYRDERLYEDFGPLPHGNDGTGMHYVLDLVPVGPV